MILFSNSFIMNLPMLYLWKPNVELLPKLSSSILHFSLGCQHQTDIRFFVEPYRRTELTSLPKTNPAAQFNYEHFIRTMAKMVQKYSDKI